MSKKKIQLIAAFFALFLSLSTLHAQQRLSFGPRLGVNFSHIVGGDAPNNKFLPGLVGGLYLMYSDINHLGISGDVLFSQKGGKYAFNNVAHDQRLNYIDIPVVGRYFLNLKGKVRPNLFLGGNAAFLLNAKKDNYTIGGVSQAAVDNTREFSTVDLGVVAGIGLNIKVSDGRWVQADLRYQRGLTTIQSNTKRFNETIGIVFAYGVGLGKK